MKIALSEKLMSVGTGWSRLTFINITIFSRSVFSVVKIDTVVWFWRFQFAQRAVAVNVTEIKRLTIESNLLVALFGAIIDTQLTE